jgi:UDP-glucuronate decarboxylase
MKRILVTVGRRFHRSHLCERLLARGYEVLSVDNYFFSAARTYDTSSEPVFRVMRQTSPGRQLEV